MIPPGGPNGPIPLSRRIGFRLLLALLGVAVSAVIVTGTAQYVLASRVMKENVALRNVQIARRAAGQIALYVSSSLNDLQAVQQSIIPIQDPWVRDLILENVVTIHRQFGSVSVVSYSGEVLASSALQNATAPIHLSAVREAVANGTLVVSPVELSLGSLPQMVVAMPCRWAGVDRAALVAELSLRDVWAMVDGISFGESGRAMLLSQDGVLIAHPDKTKILTRAAGSAIAAAALQNARQGGSAVQSGGGEPAALVAVWPVEGVPWYVVVQQTLRDAWVPLGAMLTYATLTMLTFVLVAVAASTVLARRFSTPLAMLVRGTERIRAGDLSHRIRIGTSDEIGRLSHAFNVMVQELEERSRRLQQSEAKYRLLTENLTEIIFSLDGEGELLYVNRQVERILGYRVADVEGMNAAQMLPGWRRPAAEDGAEDREQRYETTVPSANGGMITLEVKLVRAEVADSGVAYYGVARDVTERKIAEQRLQVYQEQLRSLASQLSLTEARERKRIAAEIHDRIGQALALTRIRLGVLASGDLSAEQKDVLRETSSLLEDVIRDTRTLIFRVSSPLLYELGLGAALERLVEQFNDEYQGEFCYEERGTVPALETDVSVLLFDAVKELLVNAVKHARARTISVTVCAEDSRVRLEVGDDGVGFDPETQARRASGGYGLFNLRERLEYMKGSMRVASCPGGGTRVTLEVPVGGAAVREGDEAKP